MKTPVKKFTFDKNQLEKIHEGIQKGLDISKYYDPELNCGAMEQIILGLEQGLDVDKYNKPYYDYFQMQEIRLGLLDGLDVDKYATKDYDSFQMEQIRLGLKSNIDINTYNDPYYPFSSMEQMRINLEENINKKDATLQPQIKNDIIEVVKEQLGDNFKFWSEKLYEILEDKNVACATVQSFGEKIILKVFLKGNKQAILGLYSSDDSKEYIIDNFLENLDICTFNEGAKIKVTSILYNKKYVITNNCIREWNNISDFSGPYAKR